MPSKVYSGAIVGLDAQLVEVEMDVSHGLRSFSIVGLGDRAIEESKERIASAIKSTKLLSPHQTTFRTLFNLAPPDSKQTNVNPEGKLFLGELSLDGKLRPIKGALSFALLAKKQHFTEIILPRANANEASLIKNIKVIGVESLAQALAYLENRMKIEP